MSNSKLVDYVLLSPNMTAPRNKPITKITIHHMAGDLSVETCGKVFQNKSKKASSNYGIDSKGRVGLYVEEANRSWASSNATNDNMAVTIEVADATGAPNWTVNETAYNKLIELCVDICQRNGIKELVWTGDKNGSLTVHRFFKATECPSEYLMAKMPEIAKTVTERLKAPNKPVETVKPSNSTPKDTKGLETAKKKADGHSKGTTLTVIANGGLNIRLGAGSNKPLAGNPIPKGAQVKWFGYYTENNSQKWYLVQHKDITGYCLSNYLV